MRKLTTISLLLLCIYESKAQGDSSAPLEAAKDSMISLYYTDQHKILPLYNGRQFNGYSNLIEGYAYYLTNDWQTGSIRYEGMWFHDIPIMYDSYKDEVIVRSPQGFPFILFSQRVQEFSFAGKNFVRLEADSNRVISPGFYQRVVSGKLTMYAKRSKQLEEKIEGLVVERKFLPNERYFLLKDGLYYSIDKQKSLLDVVRDRRQEMQDHLKQQGIRFKNTPETAIIKVAEFYNQPSK